MTCYRLELDHIAPVFVMTDVDRLIPHLRGYHGQKSWLVRQIRAVAEV